MTAFCALIDKIGLLLPILLLVVAIIAPFLFLLGGRHTDAISAETNDYRRRVVDWKSMITPGSLGPDGEWFRLTVLGIFVLMAGALAFAIITFGLIQPLHCSA